MALGVSAPTWASSGQGSMGGAGRTPARTPGSIFNPGNAWNVPSGGSPAPSYGGTMDRSAAEEQSKYRSIFDAVNQQYAPDRAYAGFTGQLQQSLAGAQGANFDSRQAGMNADFGLNNRYIDLQQQGLGVDRQGAERDQGYYNQMLGLMPQYRGLSKQELSNTLGKLAQTGNMDRIGINSDYTSRGAWFAPMRDVKRYDSYMTQAAGENSAQIGFDRDNLGLTEKEAGLKRSLGGSQDALAKLDIESQRLGLDREKLKNQLDQGLSQLGYDRFVSTTDLLQKMASQNKSEADMARKIMDEVMGLSNLGGAGYNTYFGG